MKPATYPRIFAAMGCLAILAAEIAPAQAVVRIRSDQNTCATVHETIDRNGSAVVRYPSTRIADYILYDRYVSPRRGCPFNEELKPDYVPAADTQRCVVYTCERIEPIFNFQDR